MTQNTLRARKFELSAAKYKKMKISKIRKRSIQMRLSMEDDDNRNTEGTSQVEENNSITGAEDATVSTSATTSVEADNLDETDGSVDDSDANDAEAACNLEADDSDKNEMNDVDSEEIEDSK